MTPILPLVVRTVSLLGLACGFAVAAPSGANSLAAAFAQPPSASRPRTWWHWMDGNVSKAGITADLEAMQRAGLGGAWLFNVGQNMPAGPAPFLSPQWLELVDHAVRECDRLGLEFGIHNCDGFSEAGGPWITPEVSMKRLTWTETPVRGPGRVRATLPQPETRLNFYREVVVLAVPAEPAGAPAAAVRASFGQVDGASLGVGRVDTTVKVPASVRGKPQWIEFTYAQPVAARSITVTTPHLERRPGRPPLVTARLEVPTGDKTWRTVAAFNVFWSIEDSPVPATTAAFDEVQSTRFRLVFQDLPEFELAGVTLSAAAHAHLWQVKAGWNRVREHGGETLSLAAPGGPERERETATGVRAADVIDVTKHLRADGTLEWDAPAGAWTIIRVGLTTTGRTNAPATPTGVGLECDKLSRRGIEAHFPNYVGRLVQKFGPHAGRALRVAETDSWECGLQNWTEDLPAEFRARRGYELTPWLPLLLTGRVLGTAAESERVLWDFRRTLADLIKDNYYAPFRDLCHRAGLTYCGEGSGRQQYMYDPLNYQSTHDLPMGEFWVPDGLRPDNRVASSVAHTYGRAIVTAEAYTGGPGSTRWLNDPFDLKALGDRGFCTGVNALVFHRYAHQFWMHVAPGMTMGQWGTMLERTVTWWEMSRPWYDYLTRCQHLLRQGTFVADVCHYLGEDVPNFLGHREDLWLPLPAGVDYDGCNDEILRRFTVRDGRLVLPHGQSYAVLLLPASRTMRPTSLRVIRDLVRAGATAIGRRPQRSPSRADLGAGERELLQLANELWGPSADAMVAATGRSRVKPIGRGRMIDATDATWAELEPLLGIAPDFTPGELPAGVRLDYTHRQVEGRDIYFVASNGKQPHAAVARFRVTGRKPELWDPMTGTVRALPDFKTEGAFTSVPLRFEPSGSCFVVFASADEVRAPSVARKNFPHYRPVQEITGAWQVAFDPKWGGPARTEFPTLGDWTKHADDGIRHYSGTATYRKSFRWTGGVVPAGPSVWLNLGKVKNLARVNLNGRDLGIVWKPPFRVDATAALRAGENELEVVVANLWVNRLIGDEKKPADMEWQGTLPKAWPVWLTDPKQPRTSGRLTFETFPHWQADEPLLPSGLLGPVVFEQEEP